MDDKRKISYGKFDDLDPSSEGYLDRVKGAMHEYLSVLENGPVPEDEFNDFTIKKYFPYAKEILGLGGVISYRKDDKGSAYYGLSRKWRDIIEQDGEVGIRQIINELAPIAARAKRERWEVWLNRDSGKWCSIH